MNCQSKTATDVLLASRHNQAAAWAHGGSSRARGQRSEDACNRIFDGLADIRSVYDGPLLRKNSRIFAMGSCFARQIEKVLAQRGANIVSVDERIAIPEFQDRTGSSSSGFFHRFTPEAMALEFERAFGTCPNWNDSTTQLVETAAGVTDLNYQEVEGADLGRAATLVRRQVAGGLVREAASAEVIIVTLGLTESWIDSQSGLHANRVPPEVLKRHRDDFRFHLITSEETVACLRRIEATVSSHRSTPFQMVVTVSPVPLMRTFTNQDVVVANETSKSTLRAAAAAFCDSTEHFPSYEMVRYSDRRLAWAADRLHVEALMVRHIMDCFIGKFYAAGELEEGAWG